MDRLPLVLATNGLLLLAGGLFAYWRSNRIASEQERWVRVGGWVVGYTPFPAFAFGKPRTYPILRFVLPDGEVVDAQSRFGMNYRPWQEGEFITVRYDPANPRDVFAEHVLIDVFSQVWTIGALAMVGLGLLIVFAGLAVGLGRHLGWIPEL
jgi:hypothetical protein